ncbi:MAG: hypothetical protein EOM93_06870 [Gammaproteobacteria bacterium]|nr:hypothetical protein [Gammaproteobacteria bacterium]
MERLIGNIIRAKYPKIMAEAEEMRDYMEGLIGLQESEYPEGAAERISDYALRIKGPMTWKACGVIVSPQINSDEDYNDLYAMLAAKGEGEEFVLDEWVAELSTIRTEYDDTAYNIAERYNVEMLDRELIENLTVSQAQFFSRRIERENRMIERLNRK